MDIILQKRIIGSRNMKVYYILSLIWWLLFVTETIPIKIINKRTQKRTTDLDKQVVILLIAIAWILSIPMLIRKKEE